MAEELKPNSHKYRNAQKEKPEEKKIEKVVNGPVKTRKKPLGKKIAETFVAEDVQDVKSYIFMDVIVPAIKDTLSEMVKQAIDMFLYGNSGRRSSRKDKPYGRVSYASYYDRDERKERARGGQKTREFYDIVLDSREEAEEVLDSLRDIIDQYGEASLTDYQDLCGVSGAYTDRKYGWTDLTRVTISRVKGQGWIVDLPKAILLD